MEQNEFKEGECFRWLGQGIIKIVKKVSPIHDQRYKIEGFIVENGGSVTRFNSWVNGDSLMRFCAPMPAADYQSIDNTLAECAERIKAIVSGNMSNTLIQKGVEPVKK